VGDHRQAAQLFGAAEGLFERAGVRGQIFFVHALASGALQWM
jgi:hypothetical protein